MSFPSRAGVRGLLAVAAFSLATPSNTTFAAPPPEGSFQWDMMQPYVDFIRFMRNCCSIADGRADMEEVPVFTKGDDGTDPNAIVYRVLMRRADYDGKAFAHLFPLGKDEVWAEVKRSQVITAEEAEEECGPIRLQNELDRAAKPDTPRHSCNAPPFNIMWVRQNSGTMGNPEVLCYWPRPKQANNLYGPPRMYANVWVNGLKANPI